MGRFLIFLLLASLTTGITFADEERGTADQDEITASLRDLFRSSSAPTQTTAVTGTWSCQVYSAIRTVYTSVNAPNRYRFTVVGHLIENGANPKFPVWQLANGLFQNHSIELIPTPQPMDPAVTRYGKITSAGKLIIEAATSDARVKALTLASVSNPQLNVFAYEICRR